MTILRNTNPFAAAAAELGKIPTAKFAAVRTVMDAMGVALANDWRRNAEQTSGEHAKKYPQTIDSERRLYLGGVAVDVGPNPAKGRQAALGPILELGTENNPPHLDGLRALDGMEDRIIRGLDAVMGFDG